eukprot:1148832-Pelagomonas_calceolata.AAC.4
MNECANNRQAGSGGGGATAYAALRHGANMTSQSLSGAGAGGDPGLRHARGDWSFPVSEQLT